MPSVGEGARSAATPDQRIILSGSHGQLSARRQKSEESSLAMATGWEWFGTTASKDSSLEVARLCLLAVTAAIQKLPAVTLDGEAGPAVATRMLRAPRLAVLKRSQNALSMTRGSTSFSASHRVQQTLGYSE